MDIGNIISQLGIGKFSIVWSFITGGWAGLAKLLCEAFTKLLSKADSEKLKEYSTLAMNIASYLRTGIDMFIKNEAVKAAAESTAKSIEDLANHISNGVYDEDELDADIANIKACIDAWKGVFK